MDGLLKKLNYTSGRVTVLGAPADLGFEGVRQVAIDGDWSALRFRRAEQIATMRRDPSRALSTDGKQRTASAVVTAFLAEAPDDRRPMLAEVDAVIRRVAPEFEPARWDRILGYGSYHYRYASGREGDWFVVGLANQKQYVSVYLCAATPDGYLAESNAHRLGKVSVGKSCIRFKKPGDLDLDVLAELVAQARDLTAAGSFAM